MHFADMHDGGGTKATKLAVVAALHVAVAMVFVHSINTKKISLPKAEEVMVLLQPEVPPPPPPPPEPPQPMPKVAPPEVVVPKLEVEIPPPEAPPPVQATTQADPTPAPAAPVQAEAPPADPSANSGAMRNAELADANGCAKPAYPMNALRNGETGTVTLALLIGADGKVNTSRVAQSSGSRDLDRAAVNALSLCRFKPAISASGTPQAGWAHLAYVWRLDD
jgi:protein TonB